MPRGCRAQLTGNIALSLRVRHCFMHTHDTAWVCASAGVHVSATGVRVCECRCHHHHHNRRRCRVVAQDLDVGLRSCHRVYIHSQ